MISFSTSTFDDLATIFRLHSSGLRGVRGFTKYDESFSADLVEVINRPCPSCFEPHYESEASCMV